MGWVREKKASVVADQAREAFHRGDVVLTMELMMPKTRPDLSGEVADWGQMIAAVEAEGWTLQHWAVGQVDSHRPAAAYPVFRRRLG